MTTGSSFSKTRGSRHGGGGGEEEEKEGEGRRGEETEEKEKKQYACLYTNFLQLLNVSLQLKLRIQAK